MAFVLKSNPRVRLGAIRARALQHFAILSVTVVASLFVLQTFDVGTAMRAAVAVPPEALLIAGLALAAALLLSSVRYHRVLNALGLHVAFRLASRANLLGIVGGLLFFQLLGQTLARTAVLSRSGVAGPSVLLASVYERITALFSLVVLAGAAVLYLYGPISIDLVGGGAGLLKLTVALVLVGLAVTFAGARRLVRFAFGKLMQERALLPLMSLSLYSLVVHLLTLVAFVLLSAVVAPNVAVGDLVAASLIVMFVASMPISFAGWGVREISAVYAYGTLGISPEKALAVSVLVGLLSIGLVLALGALSTGPRTSAAFPGDPVFRSATMRRSVQIERSVSWLIPILAAGLVFFQVHLPVSDGAINVNLADPIAIGGGLVFLARYLSLHQRGAGWRVDNFEMILIAMTAVIAFALVNGWVRFGYSDWAFYNRFVGWLVLLAYLGTGALIVGANPASGLDVLLKCMLVSGLAITLLDLGVVAGAALGLPLRVFLPQVTIAGMAQNANAFALQAAVLMAIYCTLQWRTGASWPRAHRAAPPLIFAALMLAICYSHSRTGMLAGAAVLIAAVSLGWVRARPVLSATAIAAAVLLLPVAMHAVLQFLHVLGFGDWLATIWLVDLEHFVGNPLKTSHPGSDAQRWFSISRGLELWALHPIFGNGLGAFVKTVKEEQGYFLIIHNTSVWLLAETGLAGLSVFAAAMLALVRSAWHGAVRGDGCARLLVLTLVCFAIFQLTHDVLYQRIVWLVFGATLFSGRLMPGAIANANR